MIQLLHHTFSNTIEKLVQVLPNVKAINDDLCIWEGFFD
ncbi:hypothetical protein CU016_0821 [Enterococcus lactis]|nr:hypothetical protein [Enterococcus lactis]MBL5014060.1 hypothetical protein [Enterococcus lactis]